MSARHEQQRLPLEPATGPFVRVPTAILGKVSANALATYTALLSFANDTGLCWPSYRRLAELAGTSRSSAQRGCNELEATGWLARTHRETNGIYGSNLWYVRVSGGVVRLNTPPVQSEQHGTRSRELDDLTISLVCSPEVTYERTQMRSTPAKKRCESYDCDHFTGIDHQTGERYPHCRACAEGTVTQRLPSDDIRAAVEAAPFMEGT